MKNNIVKEEKFTLYFLFEDAKLKPISVKNQIFKMVMSDINL